MNFQSKRTTELGSNYVLSPEHWLSMEAAASMGAGRKFGDLVCHVREARSVDDQSGYVFDTSYARDGLLEVPIHASRVKGRSGTKKIAEEGDVIVSRLRPYLRQVAWIPSGATEILGQSVFYVSTEFLIFRPNNKERGPSLAAWLLSENIQKIMNEAATGGHHPRIDAELLLNASVGSRFLADDLATRLAPLLLSHLKGQVDLKQLLGE